MGRIARLEKEVADLKDALANMTFRSDAPFQQVEVPTPVLDSNGVPTGAIATAYLQIKTGPTSGKIQLNKNAARLVVE